MPNCQVQVGQEEGKNYKGEEVVQKLKMSTLGK